VRQLRAVVRRAFAEAGDVEAVDAAHLGLEAPTRFDLAASLEWKQRLVRWALWRTKGRVREAAELIGAHRNTVSAIKANWMITTVGVIRARRQGKAFTFERPETPP
jgi:transcriptional regulator of acetoin/glycerol metabolism